MAFGERNTTNINPLYFTIDADNSDFQIIWDEKSKLPFKNDSINFIYSSHTLEHLSYDEAKIFFKEAKRVLKKGGELCIEVPNAKFLYDNYLFFLKNKKSKINNQLIDFEFHKKVLINIKKFQNLPDEKINDWSNHFSTKIFAKVSNYVKPDFVGYAIPYLIDPKTIEKNFYKFQNMDKFFDWLLNKIPTNLKKTGGHNSYWYYNQLSVILDEMGYACFHRGYRQSKYFKNIISKIMVPDRKYRSFYSIRISAIKK